MIFAVLWNAAKHNELILIEGGMCHWHLRRDGQLTIREIIVLPEYQGRGIGTQILEQLRTIEGAQSILAKCPRDLEANGWYEHMGFTLLSADEARSGRKINVWRLALV